MNKFYLALAFLAVLTTAGCSGLGGFGNKDSDTGADSSSSSNSRSGPKVSDSEITSSIKDAFKQDSELATANISVNSNNGVVSLSGNVPSAQSYNRAISLARSVDGVRPPVMASDLKFPQ